MAIGLSSSRPGNDVSRRLNSGFVHPLACVSDTYTQTATARFEHIGYADP